MAYVDGGHAILATADGRPTSRLPLRFPGVARDFTPYSELSWSPDGNHLLFVGFDQGGSFAVVSLPTDPGSPARLLTPMNGAFYQYHGQGPSWQAVSP
jgi:hypothetical protein